MHACIKFNACVCDKLQLHTNIRMMRHKMFEKTFKSAKKITNWNDVTHNTKHTILINKTKFTPYSVPPAHALASVLERSHNRVVVARAGANVVRI